MLQVYVVRGYQRMVERDADRRRVLVVPARGGIWRVVQCMRKAFVVHRNEREKERKQVQVTVNLGTTTKL